MSEHTPGLFLGAIEALNDEIEAFQQTYVDEQATLAAMLEARKALEVSCDLLTACEAALGILRRPSMFPHTRGIIEAAIAKAREGVTRERVSIPAPSHDVSPETATNPTSGDGLSPSQT